MRQLQKRLAGIFLWVAEDMRQQRMEHLSNLPTAQPRKIAAGYGQLAERNALAGGEDLGKQRLFPGERGGDLRSLRAVFGDRALERDPVQLRAIGRRRAPDQAAKPRREPELLRLQRRIKHL